jgi:hypothetical protein
MLSNQAIDAWDSLKISQCCDKLCPQTAIFHEVRRLNIKKIQINFKQNNNP